MTQWGQKTERLPLLMCGARQVGKTWLVREYSKSFEQFVELNLESHPEYIAPFRDFYGKPHQLVDTLSLMTGKKIVAAKTILFIDEIQESKDALLSLRYFKENFPELHVVAAGSLVEFSLKELSFPVGRIHFFHLFPMSFREYLMAIGRSDLVSAIADASPEKPLPAPIHEMLLREVAIYVLLGGMPAVLKGYTERKDLADTQEIQQILVSNFRADFRKYASHAAVEHVQRVFESVPRFLGQKFKYSNVSRETKSRELSKAFSLIEDAGLIYRVCHTSANGVPLGAESDRARFKAFFVDTGLCLRILGLSLSKLITECSSLLANRGALAEQYVAQELIAGTPKNEEPELYYWHREAPSARAEVDFVIAKDGKVYPIEVKSGASGAMKSAHVFLKEKKSGKAYKISAHPFSRDGHFETIPFYAVWKLTE